jgi:LPS sulfotransferase NodH
MHQPTTLSQAMSLADTNDTIQWQFHPQLQYNNPRCNYKAENLGTTPMELNALGKLTQEECE